MRPQPKLSLQRSVSRTYMRNDSKKACWRTGRRRLTNAQIQVSTLSIEHCRRVARSTAWRRRPNACWYNCRVVSQSSRWIGRASVVCTTSTVLRWTLNSKESRQIASRRRASSTLTLPNEASAARSIGSSILYAKQAFVIFFRISTTGPSSQITGIVTLR